MIFHKTEQSWTRDLTRYNNEKFFLLEAKPLTHWGRVTHICVSKQTILGSDNGLAPGRHQAIIWTNAGILLIRTLGTRNSYIFIQENVFENVVRKLAAILSRPQCVNLQIQIKLTELKCFIRVCH